MKVLPSVLLCGLLLGGLGTARAQNRGLDVQMFRPAIGPTGLFSLDTARIDEPGTQSYGFFYNYQKDPLVFRQRGQVVERAVSDVQTLNLLWSSAVTNWLQLGVDLPLHLRMDGRGGAVLQPGIRSLEAHGIGDVRFDLKWRLLGRPGDTFGLAIATPFTLPSGRGDLFRGEQDATFSPRLIFDGLAGRVTFAAQLGYLVRRDLLYAGQRFGNELLYGAGLGVALWRDQGGTESRTRDRLSLAAELFGRASAVKPTDNGDQVPVEALVGVKFMMPDQNLALSAGLGFGLNTSYGTPEVRAFVGLRWTSSVQAPRPCPKAEPPPPPPPCPTAPACPAQKECPAEKVCPEQLVSSGPSRGQKPCAECMPCTQCKACPPAHECPAAPPPVTTVRLRHVYFAMDQATPLDKSRPSLDKLVDLLKKHPSIVARVEGHTDSRGNAAYNKRLSQRRAEGVRTYLIAQGIEAERVTAVGHGAAKAVAPNATKQGRQENRRVEVHFTKGVPDQLRIDLEKMEF